MVSSVLNSLIERVEQRYEVEECLQGTKRAGVEDARPAKRKCRGKKKCPTCKREANGNRQHQCCYCGYIWTSSRSENMSSGLNLSTESIGPNDIGQISGLGPEMSIEELDYFFASIDAVPGDVDDEFCDPFCLSWDDLASSSEPICV